jgi:hypothetical protein
MQFSSQQFCHAKEEEQIQKEYFLLFIVVMQADNHT